MINLLLTILGIGSVVAIMSSIISSYLDETTQNEFFTNEWNDTLSK